MKFHDRATPETDKQSGGRALNNYVRRPSIRTSAGNAAANMVITHTRPIDRRVDFMQRIMSQAMTSRLVLSVGGAACSKR